MLPRRHAAAQVLSPPRPSYAAAICNHQFGKRQTGYAPCAGAVASLVTLLLREHGLPPGLGAPHCVAIGPAAVMSADLADAAKPLITSVCLRRAVPQLAS
jgi:hypothetical protein